MWVLFDSVTGVPKSLEAFCTAGDAVPDSVGIGICWFRLRNLDVLTNVLKTTSGEVLSCIKKSEIVQIANLTLPGIKTQNQKLF